MNERLITVGWCTLFLLTLTAVVQVLFYYPQLPATVASHFDAQGNPDGEMPKGTLAAIIIGMNVFLGALFLAIGPLMKRLPIGLINIPSREYWLSGDRRDASLKTIAGFSYWMGIITILLVMIIFQLTVIANIQRMNLHGTVFWFAVIGYLVVTFLSCFWLLLRFKKPN